MRILTIKCDRCKRTINGEPDEIPFIMASRKSKLPSKKYDLCNECYEKVLNMVITERKQTHTITNFSTIEDKEDE